MRSSWKHFLDYQGLNCIKDEALVMKIKAGGRISKELIGRRMQIYNGRQRLSFLLRPGFEGWCFNDLVATKKIGHQNRKSDSKSKKK